MSTTGPMTRATRPTTTSGVDSAAGALAVLVGVMVSRFRSRSRRERIRARDDLADFLGNLCLARRVGEPGVVADDFLGVRHRGVHGALTVRELRGGRLEQDRVDAGLDVSRQQRVENVLRARLEVVQRGDDALVVLL